MTSMDFRALLWLLFLVPQKQIDTLFYSFLSFSLYHPLITSTFWHFLNYSNYFQSLHLHAMRERETCETFSFYTVLNCFIRSCRAALVLAKAKIHVLIPVLFIDYQAHLDLNNNFCDYGSLVWKNCIDFLITFEGNGREREREREACIP